MTKPGPILSHSVPVELLPVDGARVTLEASVSERESLARSYGLAGIARLTAEFHLQPKSAGTVLVTGRVHAAVTQICTVSADPFEAAVDEVIDVTFMPEKGVEAWLAKRRADTRDEPGLTDDDPPDMIRDGRIDVGQLASEFLSLGLDPYPRKPGVVFDAEAYAPDKDQSPFAVLSSLGKDR